MTRTLQKKDICSKLDSLHRSLPKPPTAIRGLYCLPQPLLTAAEQFSEEALQAVANHMAAYLGVLTPVKVTIGIENSPHMLAGREDLTRADQVGLYKVIGGIYREIQLTKKFQFKLNHVLGILAHESMHNYLYSHRVRYADESGNEIITDLAAVYAGFGKFMIEGYEPIVWKTHSKTGNGTGFRRDRLTMKSKKRQNANVPTEQGRLTVKRILRDALDDRKHKRYVILKDYLRGKRSPVLSLD